MTISPKWIYLLVILGVASTGRSFASEISAALNQYLLESKKNSSALIVADQRRKLRKSILKLVEQSSNPASQGSADFSKYKDALKEVEQALKQNPDAVYRLVKELQTDWEVRYGEQLANRQKATVAKTRYAGALIAMTAAARLQPQDIGKYFQVVRYLLPVVGAETAATATQAVQQKGILDQDIPLSPAHLLNMNVAGTPVQNDDEAVRTLSTLLSVATLPAVDVAVKKVGQMAVGSASNPAPAAVGLAQAMDVDPCTAMSKDFLRLILSGPVGRAAGYSAVRNSATQTLNPLSFLGAWVLSDAVEKGVDAGYRAKKIERMKENVSLAQQSLRTAMEKKDRALMLASADALVVRARDLSEALQGPMLVALAEYQAAVMADPVQEPVLRQKLEERIAALKVSSQKEELQFQTSMNRYTELALLQEQSEGTEQTGKLFLAQLRDEDKKVMKIQARSHSGMTLLKSAAFLRQWDDPALFERADSLMEMAAEQMEGSDL